MRKQKMIGVLLCIGLMYACSPKIKTVLSSGQQVKSLAYDAEVYVYSVNESVPDGVIKNNTDFSGGHWFYTEM